MNRNVMTILSLSRGLNSYMPFKTKVKYFGVYLGNVIKTKVQL